MKALTLKQPWAWAVAHAGKDVENRTWKPPASVIGQRIAIHAGKGWSEAGGWALQALANGLFPPIESHIVFGAIIAVATIRGCVGVEASCFNRWIDGPYGWLLTHVIALPKPIPCRGNQGLWNVPADIEAEIDRQLKHLDILDSVDAGARAKKGEVLG
jgi:hypothetical protein